MAEVIAGCRVKTPPGAQTQSDWAEYPSVDLGASPEPLSGFVMVLSHTRKPAMVWSRGKDLLAWLDCHNAAYRRLAGVAAVNRVDNVKTAVVYGAEAAQRYGEIMAARRGAGRPMSILHGQIAAIARDRRLAVATRNVRDFELCGLEVVDPFEPPQPPTAPRPRSR